MEKTSRNQFSYYIDSLEYFTKIWSLLICVKRWVWFMISSKQPTSSHPFFCQPNIVHCKLTLISIMFIHSQADMLIFVQSSDHPFPWQKFDRCHLLNSLCNTAQGLGWFTIHTALIVQVLWACWVYISTNLKQSHCLLWLNSLKMIFVNRLSFTATLSLWIQQILCHDKNSNWLT